MTEVMVCGQCKAGDAPNQGNDPVDECQDPTIQKLEFEAARAFAKEVPLISGGTAEQNLAAAQNAVEAMVHQEAPTATRDQVVEHLTNLARKLEALYAKDPERGTSWMDRCANADPNLAAHFQAMLENDQFASNFCRAAGAEVETGADTPQKVVTFLSQLAQMPERKK